MNDWVSHRAHWLAIIAAGITTACSGSTGSISRDSDNSQPVREASVTTRHLSTDFRPDGYESTPVFADEFNGTSLDRSKWCTRFAWGASRDDPQQQSTPGLQVPDAQCTQYGQGILDYVNDENQRYRDYNRQGKTLHEVGNGIIRLIATRNSDDPNDLTFESAMLRSKQLFRPDPNKSYYIAARVKLPGIRGTWPTIWFAPSLYPTGSSQWPPEIDILETPLNGSPAESRFTVWQKSIVGNPASGQGGLQTATRYREFNVADNDYNITWGYWNSPFDLHANWIHVGAEWTNEQVCYYINQTRTACENYRWVEDQGNLSSRANPATLLINLAIGGDWAGKNGVDKAAFPAAFELDYVRIYERRLAGQEDYGTAVTAVADVNGYQPEPVRFANGRVYASKHVARNSRGGLTPSKNEWVEAGIDAGNCANSASEVSVRDLSQARSVQVSFCGLNAQSTSYAGQAYAFRLDRPRVGANWQAALYRNNGAGQPTTALASQSNAMTGNTWEAKVLVQVSGSTVRATLTPLGGSPVSYVANDNTYRGNWIGTTIDASNGARPVWTWRYGLSTAGTIAPAASPAAPVAPSTPAPPAVPVTPNNENSLAVSSIDGTKPSPNSLGNGASYVASNVQRLANGDYSPSENKWAFASIDANNCTGKTHAVTIKDIAQATSLQTAFCGSDANVPTYKGFAYALRLDRPAPGMPWSATLYRNNGEGLATTPLASQANALTANATEVTMRVRADTATITASLTAPGETTRSYSANDSAYRGNWVGFTTDATNGARPTWRWNYNAN